ncbi:MAG: SDR family NAD(P)-dependent oxidoreductase, partial [Spirochaetales bacterium]|nr:SDR family NAD(P)-dependent oxidoreductase [Spirochaetales bacterium]
MNLDLSGQGALVTGAGRGIGRAIGSALASAGARVFLAARTTDQLESAAREIQQNGGTAVPVPTDLSKEEDIQSLFQRISDRAGGLDILVNNAGVGFFG